jgi:hypothetical protein
LLKDSKHSSLATADAMTKAQNAEIKNHGPRAKGKRTALGSQSGEEIYNADKVKSNSNRLRLSLLQMVDQVKSVIEEP